MEMFAFRRDLLRLLGVGEFSAEATFRDPCSSLVLPEVSTQVELYSNCSLIVLLIDVCLNLNTSWNAYSVSLGFRVRRIFSTPQSLIAVKFYCSSCHFHDYYLYHHHWWWKRKDEPILDYFEQVLATIFHSLLQCMSPLTRFFHKRYR